MTTPLFLRQTLAEWKPVWAVIRRTRLALRLAGLGLAGIGASGWAGGAFLPRLVLGVALTATVTALAAFAGPQAGRAHAMTLRHPASPLALAAGRWLAVVALAGLVTLAAGVGAAWQVELGWREGVDAAVAAGGVALPVAACGVLVSVESWRRRTP